MNPQVRTQGKTIDDLYSLIEKVHEKQDVISDKFDRHAVQDAGEFKLVRAKIHWMWVIGGAAILLVVSSLII